MKNILIPEYVIEDFIEQYLERTFGGLVDWEPVDHVRALRVQVNSFMNGKDLPEGFEDEWM